MESRGGPAPPQLKRVLRRSSVPSFKHVERVRNSSATRVSMRFWNTALRRRSCHPRRLLRALSDESHAVPQERWNVSVLSLVAKQRPAGRRVSKVRTDLGLTYDRGRTPSNQTVPQTPCPQLLQAAGMPRDLHAEMCALRVLRVADPRSRNSAPRVRCGMFDVFLQLGSGYIVPRSAAASAVRVGALTAPMSSMNRPTP